MCQALKDWRYRTRQVKYKYFSLKAENILPDSNLSTIASHRHGVKTVADLKHILKPPWPHVAVHGGDILELVQSLDKAEDLRHMVATLKKCQDRKAVTARCRAEAVTRKELEREAARAEREAGKLHSQCAQTAVSYSGPMGPSAALNGPATLIRPAGSSQPSAPSPFSSYSPIPYTGYMLSPYLYAIPYGYAPSAIHSPPAATPPSVASSSASRPPPDPRTPQPTSPQTFSSNTSSRT
ncbi:hypothetical protein LXA43DRAFT_1104126 [Ganoderma leucocontextum]|nr:hypothetical protein LXA43DRAFT_1104126 [Ganoderma leucocontextum]